MHTKRSRAIFHVMLLASLLATLVGSAAFVQPARADTIDVTSTADDGPGSLRQAVLDAASGDTITFSVSGTITFLSQIAISKNLVISGPGAASLTLSGNGVTRLFEIHDSTVSISDLTLAHGYTSGSGGAVMVVGGTLVLDGVTFTDNHAPAGFGGAISTYQNTLMVDHSTFSLGTATYGGGIAFDARMAPASTLTVLNSTFLTNTADMGGGLLLTNAILVAADNTFADNVANNWGGGVFFDSTSNPASTFSMQKSTFTSNGASLGGGLYLSISGDATLANSTIASNSASGFGGGLLSMGDGALALTNNTFSGNSATTGGGIAKFSTLSLVNNILANSLSGDDCMDFGGAWGVLANNLMESGNCPITNNVDPLLGPLADNGGPTETFSLLPGSPAIDSGDNAACTAPPVNNLDQRGVTRPLDGNGDGTPACDMGSFESLEMSTTTISTDSPDSSVTGQDVSVSVTVTSATGTPGGTVNVSGADTNCTITLAAGGGSCSVGFSSTGAKTLTATYTGDATHSGSQDTEGHTVVPADTTTTITTDSPDPSAGGHAVSAGYTVAAASPGSGVPTGNVTVSDGVDSCTNTVAAGSCSLTLTTAGLRTLTATYAGDSNFNGSSDTEAHTVDASPPQVGSITRADASPTNAASVDFTVTFTEPVTGVDASDFNLAMGGSLSGASVSGVSGAGAVYTVNVDTGTGSGSLRLDVDAMNTIEDFVGNPLSGAFTDGESYTIDKDAPQVNSSTRIYGNPTNADSVVFRVTFSEAVTGVDVSDFTLAGGGSLVGFAVSGMTGSGTTYNVTVSTGSGDGTLRLDVVDDDTIHDAVGNPLGAGFTGGESYTVDRTAPTVVSSNLADPNPTNATSVDFVVTFSEAVTGVDTSDFSVATTGNLVGTGVSGVTGSGTAYTVTVSTGSGNGRLTLDVVDDNSILDLASNPLNGGFTAGQSYTVDKTAPTVVSSNLVDPNPTSAASVDFEVTFSEAVTGVDVTDFAISTTGSLAGTVVSGVTGSGTTYTVSVSTGSGAGNLRLDVLDDDTVVDTAGNPLAGGFTLGEVYQVGFTYNWFPLMIYDSSPGGR